jgi:hypothetical protein
VAGYAPAVSALAAEAPTVVPLLIMALVVLVASVGLLAAFARGSDPGPAETAVAYERAWDRLDFATLWDLSSPRLRDGRTRSQFVRDKEAAYKPEPGLANLIVSVRPERVDVSGPTARVLTRLELRDGHRIVDEMLLERAGSVWQVAAYHVASRRGGGGSATE